MGVLRKVFYALMAVVAVFALVMLWLWDGAEPNSWDAWGYGISFFGAIAVEFVLGVLLGIASLTNFLWRRRKGASTAEAPGR